MILTLLSSKAMEALKSSEYWTPKTRVTSKTIQNLVCPCCGDTTAWAYAIGHKTGPMAICCNRKNNCGAITKTVDLFNILLDIEKEYPATPRDKNKPARIYLESRGIRRGLKDLEYEYWPKVRKESSSGAVMFPVQTPDEETIFNGRLLNPETGIGKTHNTGSTTGCWWTHPCIDYNPEEKIFITEGIIDALSLIEIGKQAVAVLSSGQDPTKINLPAVDKLVIAFDNDIAGAAGTKKWLQFFPDAEAIMPDKGQDWNDLLSNGHPQQVKALFTSTYERFEKNAQLALAESPRRYATVYHQFFQKAPGLFEFDGCTYYSEIKTKGEMTQLVVNRVGRFTFKVRSFLRDTSNPDKPEYSYHLQITPKGKMPVTSTAASRDLATPKGLKEFFLARAGTTFEGTTNTATALSSQITSSSVPLVTQLSLTGHDLETGWRVYKHFAVDPKGKVHKPDKSGLYRVNHQTWIRAATHDGNKAICPNLNTSGNVKKIHKLVNSAWGNNGAAAFAFMIASLFVNDVKACLNWFPFCSFAGAPGSGKSALVTILNACQGVDGEGLPMTSLNSKKGLARSISRVSGMFTALLEDNRRDQSNFDYSIILTGYNQGPLQIQAAYSGDNRTTEAPFLGTLLFCQNNEPFTTQAEKERVISLLFDINDITANTREAYEKLVAIAKQELASVAISILQRRREFESEWRKEYEKLLSTQSEVKNRRIMQNHTLILAFHNLTCKLFNINHDLTSFILQTAKRKVITSAERDYTGADRFIDALTYLDQTKVSSCVHIDKSKKRLFFNLPGAEAQLRNAGVQVIAQDLLIQSLTKHPGFIENSKVFRFPNDPDKGADGRIKSRRVWVFDLTQITF